MKKRKRWFRGAIQLQGSVIPSILPRTLICGFFGLAVSTAYSVGLPISEPTIGTVVPSVVLGLLLVFRTNTAYERFWEGRKMWGTLNNAIRNLARQIWVAVDEKEDDDRPQKIATLKLLIAFAIAMKLHLRNQSVNEELEALVTMNQYQQLQAVTNPPLRIALWIGDYLQSQFQQNRLNSYQVTTMHQLLDMMVDALGACERILKTPMPLAYGIHLRQLLLLYCLLLPFQVVHEMHWLTGFVVFLVSFTLLGIEAIGLEIENPFGHDPNDLPLDSICNSMGQNLEDLIHGGLLIQADRQLNETTPLELTSY